MSGYYSKEAVIRCDLCGTMIGEVEITIIELRKSGQFNGWKMKEGGDYCPKCQKGEK